MLLPDPPTKRLNSLLLTTPVINKIVYTWQMACAGLLSTASLGTTIHGKAPQVDSEITGESNPFGLATCAIRGGSFLVVGVSYAKDEPVPDLRVGADALRPFGDREEESAPVQNRNGESAHAAQA